MINKNEMIDKLDSLIGELRDILHKADGIKYAQLQDIAIELYNDCEDNNDGLIPMIDSLIDRVYLYKETLEG